MDLRILQEISIHELLHKASIENLDVRSLHDRFLHKISAQNPYTYTIRLRKARGVLTISLRDLYQKKRKTVRAKKCPIQDPPRRSPGDISMSLCVSL